MLHLIFCPRVEKWHSLDASLTIAFFCKLKSGDVSWMLVLFLFYKYFFMSSVFLFPLCSSILEVDKAPSCSIYTTMLGKKSSISDLCRRLSRIDGVRYTVSTLSQGRTQRWVLAWTFLPQIQLEKVCSLLTLNGSAAESPQRPFLNITSKYLILSSRIHSLLQCELGSKHCSIS